MIHLDIKPLSVNRVWQGRRFKTKEYKDYEQLALTLLPKELNFPKRPYHFIIEFGFSSKAADADNCVKPILDIMQKKYGFNDKEVYRLWVEKKIVEKGKEYVKIEICSIG